MTDTSTTIDQLAQLRFSVLLSGEANPDTWWDSDGLSVAGQADLRIIFPRTSVCAALSHVAELARRHHDQRTRAAGVFHLFRLPSDIEAGVHRSLVNLEQDGFFGDDPSKVAWQDLADAAESAQEGAVDLGALDLNKEDDIKRLAGVYKAAFDAEKSCVPYFKLR